MTFDFKDKPEVIQLQAHVSHKKGTLFAIEDFELGVPIKRAFYITDFSSEQALNNRGDHSHVSSSQFIINIKGEVEIRVVAISDLMEYTFVLNSPSQCMYLPANHHIFMNHYSEDAVMLVLCDKNFAEDEVNDFVFPEILDGFREAAKYLGVSLISIIEHYNELHKEHSGRMKFKHLSENEFDQRFGNEPPSPGDLIEFYRNTDNYILELTEYHSTHARHYMTKEVVRLLKEYQAYEVLDYGCGVGEDSIALLENELKPTLCDIAGKTYDFARWRLEQRGHSPAFIEIHSEDQYQVLGDQQFDAIICFEVLMHVPEPVKTLKLLYSHLKPGGQLFLTHRFTGNYSLALAQNQHFDNSIDKVIDEQGLSLVTTVPVWQGKQVYVYQKQK